VDLLRVFLPVIWAFASTLMGLVLYRSSAALFEQTKKKDGEVRRIRLVGSIVIAAVIYLGLWKATPVDTLMIVPSGSKMLRASDLHDMVEQLREADAAFSSLEACMAITPPSQCRAEVDILRGRVTAGRSRARKLAE
jgi:hypothetical protein